MTKRKLRRAAERALRNSSQSSSSPISPAQQTANQANALRSTGPRTPEGQAISSQNSFRHGLAGAAFDALLDGLRTEHSPQSTTEDILVEDLAHCRADLLLCHLVRSNPKSRTRQRGSGSGVCISIECASYRKVHERATEPM